MTTDYRKSITNEIARDDDVAPDLDSDPTWTATPGFEGALGEARRAAGGGRLDTFVERVAERVGASASVSAVFGTPVERDGITVIPVARVRWGFGGGSGSGPVAVGPGIDGAGAPEGVTTGRPGFGTGGGGGAFADPIGYLEIGPGGATFRAIVPAMPSPAFLLAAGVTAALVIRALARLLRR